MAKFNNKKALEHLNSKWGNRGCPMCDAAGNGAGGQAGRVAWGGELGAAIILRRILRG